VTRLRLPIAFILALAACPERTTPADSGRAALFEARRLVKESRLDEATEAYVALWQDHSAATASLRAKDLRDDIRKLTTQHPPARQRFVAIRDAAAPGAKPDPVQLGDWLELNDALGESAKTLAWFDKVPAAVLTQREYAGVLELEVIPLLMEAGRWADAGRAYQDPIDSIRLAAAAWKPRGFLWLLSLPVRGIEDKAFRDEAAWMVRALHAAGRDADADSVAAEAKRVDASAEMSQALTAALTHGDR
jgi:hypothetical protein